MGLPLNLLELGQLVMDGFRTLGVDRQEWERLFWF